MENFDLFTKLGSANGDSVSPSENTKPQTEAGQPSINLFGEQPVPIVPKDQAPAASKTAEVSNKEEAPVVPVNTTETKKKTKSKAKGKASSELANKLKEQKEKQENMTITPEWTIAYSAQQYHVPHDMKIEEVREWMEVDYPELSKERTTWDIDESKRLLVPIVSGAKKG